MARRWVSSTSLRESDRIRRFCCRDSLTETGLPAWRAARITARATMACVKAVVSCLPGGTGAEQSSVTLTCTADGL